MNIYDEAIEKMKEIQRELNINWGSQPKSWWNVKINKSIQALERAKKVEELLKQYQVLAHDYEVLSNNKDRTKLGLLIFAVEEGKRVIKQLEEELK